MDSTELKKLIAAEARAACKKIIRTFVEEAPDIEGVPDFLQDDVKASIMFTACNHMRRIYDELEEGINGPDICEALDMAQKNKGELN